MGELRPPTRRFTHETMAAHAMRQLCTQGTWNIIFDKDFDAAKKVKRAVRDEFFKQRNDEMEEPRISRPKGKSSKHKGQSQATDSKSQRFVDREEKQLDRIANILAKEKEDRKSGGIEYYNIVD